MPSGKVVYSDKAVRMKPKSDRMGYSFIAKSKAGRPSKQRLSVLVSFTTAAYVNATGKEYSRCLYHNNSTAFFFWFDVEGRVYGKSSGVTEANDTRAILPVPLLLIPRRCVCSPFAVASPLSSHSFAHKKVNKTEQGQDPAVLAANPISRCQLRTEGRPREGRMRAADGAWR